MTQKIKLYAATYLMEICYGLFLLVAALLAAKAIASPFLLGLTGSLHVATRIFGNVGFGRWSGAAMTYFASMFYGQDKAPDRGTKSGFHEMILGLGMLAGPLVGGGLAEVFTLSAPFAFCAFTVLGSMGLEVILYTRKALKNGLHARAGLAPRRP